MEGDALLERAGAGSAPDSTSLAMARLHSRRVELRHAVDELLPKASEPDPLSAVRSVLVVCSASRSGSSLFVRLLTRQPGFYSLMGESATFLRLHGLAGLGSESDAVFHHELLTPQLRHELARDLRSDLVAPFRPMSVSDHDAWTRFAARFLSRLILQCPNEAFSPRQALRLLCSHKSDGLRAAAQRSLPDFYVTAAQQLEAQLGCTIPVQHYDLGRPRDGTMSSPPHPSFLIEEPPFELAPLCETPTAEDFETGCLVLKCPADSYRLDWPKRVFPNAVFHYVHLARNPAASINGLIDGWLSNGFFSRRIDEPRLRIRGYSDLSAAGSRWWKFDLPPAWSEMVAAPLAQVCAFQWASNNAAILAHGGAGRESLPRFSYDELLSPLARRALLVRIAQYVGLPLPPSSDFGAPLPLVQATAAPEPGRWRRREETILGAIRSTAAAALAEELGFSLEDHRQWS